MKRFFLVSVGLALVAVPVLAQESGEMPEMNLRAILTWLVGGAGAGLVAWWIINRIPALKQLDAFWLRLVAFGIAAVFAGVAWAIELAMGFVPAPVGVEGWTNATIAILVACYAATAVSQLTHGVQKAITESRV